MDATTVTCALLIIIIGVIFDKLMKVQADLIAANLRLTKIHALTKCPEPKKETGFLKSMNTVQQRNAANDEILTPPAIAAQQIADTKRIYETFFIDDMTLDYRAKWFDGFKNTGVYYNQYPEDCEKDYAELLEGKDFFKHEGDFDICCGNPPFSLMCSKKNFCGIWEHLATKKKPLVISMVTGSLSISPQLIARMNKWGYHLQEINQFKVQKWVPSCYTIWINVEEHYCRHGCNDEGVMPTIFKSSNFMNKYVDVNEEYHNSL